MGIESDIRGTRQLYAEMHQVLDLPSESHARIVPMISAWSPLQQIAHVSKANRWALSTVVAIVTGRSDIRETGSPKPIGRLVLRSGVIPRGIGKSPAAAMPDEGISLDRLTSELGLQLANIDKIDERLDAVKSTRYTFRHPYFGHLNPRQWVRFVRVHTNHHMKIVREILSAEVP